MDQLRLVMIEDNPGDVMLLKMALQDIGSRAHITVCTDGEAAITLITGNHPPPSAVILDLNVPLRDGLEVLEILRATPTWQTVPVVVFTAGLSRRDREKVSCLGADYMPKPHGYSGFLETATEIWAKLNDSLHSPSGIPRQFAHLASR